MKIQWNKAALGVDLSGGAPLVALAQRRGRQVELRMLRPDSPELAAAVAAGVPCAGALSSRESFTRWIEAPYASAAKAAKVFPTLLDVQMPFPLEECEYAFIAVARTPGRATRALAVAARRRDVEKRLDVLKAAGIDPEALDCEVLALWCGAERELGPAAGLRVVVWLADDRVSLAIGRGNVFLSGHSAKPGDTAQVLRLLRAQDEAAPVEWVWAGPQAAEVGTLAPVQGSLLRDRPGPSIVATDPAAFLARACAARLLSGPKWRCNLRSGTLAHPAVARRQAARSARLAILALVAALVLCMFNILLQVGVSRRAVALDRRFAAGVRELAGIDPGGLKGEKALQLARDKIGERFASVRPLVEPFLPSLLDRLGGLVAEAGAADLRFDSVSLERAAVRISGTAGAWRGPDGLVAQLRKAGYDVKLDRKDAQSDERIPFVISTGGEK